MRDRWMQLCERISADPGWASAVYDDVALRYSEPCRAYHTLEHVGHCLYELDLAKHLACNRDAIEFAIWLHDVVYRFSGSGSEEQSARYATTTLLASRLLGARVRPSFIERVGLLILATDHVGCPEDPDAKLICDVDLAILGKSPSWYRRYEQQIREEYNWVPEKLFRTRRREVLESFLGRDFIFNTGLFRARYERRARENIRRELEKLG